MVVRTRRQRILQAMGLYAAAAALIAYFGFHAYHGEHGIHAKQQFLEQIVELNGQLTALRKEKAEVARRVSLLRAEAIDPDMLDERAREILNFVDPRDLVQILRRR
jgi:cell division protein FtsB